MARSRKGKRRLRLTWVALLVLVAAGVSFRYVEKLGQEKAPADRFSVKRVIDGDTIELTGGDKLRLLAIDTPEKGEKFHDEAMNYLAHLALGKSARIEYANNRRDRYGRLLGYLYVDDTLFVNKAILDSGLTYLYLFKDNDLKRAEVKELLQAQRHAMKKRSGLFGVQHEPEEYYVANTNAYRFHRPSCPSLEEMKPGNLRHYATREEALSDGLSPCRNCKP